ncbi:MAG: hypothetical protein GY851_00420 [bacterium]|nr:hypothetical protein [bacterium]
MSYYAEQDKWFTRAFLLVFLLGVIISDGCEPPGSDTLAPGFYGDAELVALAEVEASRLGVWPMQAITVAWGGESLYLPDRIEISEAERGRWWARVHMKHELMHIDDERYAAELAREHAINEGLD